MITVLYTHQSKKLELELDPERPISHLMDRLEEITDVPVGNMKVIFGGKTISTIPAMPIGQSGLKNGSKIMMLGKKVNAAEDSLIQGLKPMRAEFETKKSKLSGLQSQVENYEKGFLQETKSLDKDIMVIAEYSMRLLEKLDGYSIAEEHKIARQKRKDLVREIQTQLDQCDVLRERLKLAPTGQIAKK